MKHVIKKRKLSRRSEHRLSMLKKKSISLIHHEQIITT
ncbi:50S ribosomal protein L17, partial [Wolbachia endosymbiont of Atemnus politus]|nr:50S ribosomal protein L17 [Wolbachia endosymbiont of Atemnus politus]